MGEPLTEQELIDKVADIPVVDSDNAESVEAFLKEVEGEGGEGEGGEKAPAGEGEKAPVKAGEGEDEEGEEKDPYAFIKEHTAYDSQEGIVQGYKDIQSHTSKVQAENDKLKAQLESIKTGKPADEITDIEELQGKGLNEVDIKNIVTESMKESLAEDKKSRDIENEQSKLDTDYSEAISLEGWSKNQNKVYGIIKEFPIIANNPSVANPYKLALEMAKSPELMKVYNKYPELLDTQGGGLRAAQDLANVAPDKVDKIIQGESDKVKDEETKRQIELQNAAVGEASSGDAGAGEKPVNEMTKEEVYKLAGYTPDDD